ncbi:MAG: PspC domain-containing protein [Treponema sp.]|nr:PspC domain-containing protein [Treponema sp.]
MTKRLYKSSEKKISGVCGGIADYFNVDPTLIRILWAVLTCCSFGFPGIVLYILAALIMPDRPSDASTEWDNMKRANEYTEKDKEFDSYFEKEKEENHKKK